MEKLADISAIAALGLLAWQDFRSRRIAWWLLPLLAIALFTGSALYSSIAVSGKNAALNIGFLAVQFLFAGVWLILRNKKISGIVDKQIGLGDVLFLLCIAPAFSPANFLVFYCAGLTITLAGYLVWRAVRKQASPEIPLAGALALPLIVLYTARIIDPAIDFYSDAWLVRWTALQIAAL